ncbi:ETX/MTX2 family pore-forming toxin [Streptomyces sp. CA-132043]|uniref:ETX/MTX2 family pore-forming toxin n=1 Tax=Streptomyces sp. CA-132043 TaxID=3240048 RepID=UPI003D8D46B5
MPEPYSKFGDILIGSINCLPRDSKKPPFNAPTTIVHKWVFEAVRKNKRKEQVAGFDPVATRADVEKTLKLEDAYTRLAEETKGHWGGKDFDKSNVSVVHTSMRANSPEGLSVQETVEFALLYDPDMFAAGVMVADAERKQPVAFVGDLVGVAPHLTATLPEEGQKTIEYSSTTTVSVSQSTQEGWEVGLTAEAGVNFKGAEVKRSLSVKWAKTTTNTTEVTKTHTESSGITIPKNEWARMDVRACAGVYEGWLAFHNRRTGKIEMYPVRGIVHVPGFVSPVAVYRMSAPSNAFSEIERALISEYSRVGTALEQAAADVNSDGQYSALAVEHARLEAAVGAMFPS